MGIMVTNGSSPTVVDTETQNSLIYYLVGKLNSSGILPITIGVSNLSAKEESACVVVEKTPVAIRRYVDGGYDGRMIVSLYYRSVATLTSAERMDILALLNKFNGYLLGLNTSDFTTCSIEGIEQSELSSLIARYDDNIEDYGIKITLNYSTE